MKIAVVGAGKLGLMVLEAMLAGGHSITLVDKNEELLDKLSSQFDVMTVAGNAKQVSFLKEINIDTYDYLIATTDKDEKNILVASFAKKLGCSKVIARVRAPEHMGQLEFIKENMDIDNIVNPDLIISSEIYKYLAEKHTLTNGVFTSGKISLLEFSTSKIPRLIGKNMTEISKIMVDMLVVAIDRNGKIIIPHGDTTVVENDTLYIVGRKEKIYELSHQVHDRGRYTNLQKVMIVGGGKTGLYLADKLSDFGASVKIIEIQKERCQYLSTKLKNVMILHGDATDLKLLEEENFDEMDAFVTATGFDEENLLLALIAKSHGIPDVIAKISRESYSEIIEKMEIDVALNPLVITANNIVRYVQGSKHLISSTLIQGQGEIIEVVVSNGMAITNVPVQELELPDGVLIAAVHRGSDVIIPNGSTIIRDGDKVMIFSLLTETGDLEKFISVKQKKGIFRG